MIAAGGYVLLVRPERRDTLLGHSVPGQAVGEPVPRFNLSRRAPLVVFASFETGVLTHIADGRKGLASATQMVRLNLIDLQPLAVPITFGQLLQAMPPRFHATLIRRIQDGGPLSPALLRAVATAVSSLAPDVAPRLARYVGGRDEVLAGLSPEQREGLAQQKESIATALRLAGLDTRQLLGWTPQAEPGSFLEGLPGARVREDAMVVHDLTQVPGFEAVRAYPFAAHVFENEDTRLTVILANKLPLEQQFGTDLIYYNETYRSFIMVQYKAMEREGVGKAEFRLPNAQLQAEIERMDRTLAALAEIPPDASRDGFRLHVGPFFLKLCGRHVFNPDDSGLFPGMYLPLDYWKRLVLDPATEGERGGRLVTFQNVGRKLSESEFIGLVAGAWVGTSVAQSQVLETIVREVLESGKAVTLAIRAPVAAEEPDDP